jgi:hypothetical protein
MMMMMMLQQYAMVPKTFFNYIIIKKIAHKLAKDGSVQTSVEPRPFLGVSREKTRRKVTAGWTTSIL